MENININRINIKNKFTFYHKKMNNYKNNSQKNKLNY